MKTQRTIKWICKRHLLIIKCSLYINLLNRRGRDWHSLDLELVVASFQHLAPCVLLLVLCPKPTIEQLSSERSRHKNLVLLTGNSKKLQNRKPVHLATKYTDTFNLNSPFTTFKADSNAKQSEPRLNTVVKWK